MARRRLTEGVAGIAALHALIADLLGDGEPYTVVVGIETDRGPWVQALLAAGYQVFAINPLSASRYRERQVCGTRRVVLARVAGDKRLRDALYLQAFSALSRSPGARAYHDSHRERGHTLHQALRALANRLVGILHGCLRHRQPYDEATTPSQLPAAA